MQIHLGSKHLIADVAVALDVAGREHLVVVAKASWRIPEPGQRPKPIAPTPLVMADQFYGEPGESALRYGSDFARFKPQCDVIFDACAHAPLVDGVRKPVRQMEVSVQVGAMKKTIRVHGPRLWQRVLGLSQLSEAEPFTKMPLHHGLAFGGTRWYDKGEQKLAEAHLPNPSGIGYAGRKTLSQIHGQPAPSLEDPRRPVKSPGGKYAPWALSPIARHWSPRRELAGTYDEVWQREVFPFLPEDFDETFNQLAPADQRIVYPSGGEAVELQGLLPQGPSVKFNLPGLTLPVRVLRDDYSREEPVAAVDTLMFETEQQRFSAVWRASVPIKRRLQEFTALAIGRIDKAWWQAKSLGLDEPGCAGCGQPHPDLMEPRA